MCILLLVWDRNLKRELIWQIPVVSEHKKWDDYNSLRNSAGVLQTGITSRMTFSWEVVTSIVACQSTSIVFYSFALGGPASIILPISLDIESRRTLNL